jgi:hypothetical protein
MMLFSRIAVYLALLPIKGIRSGRLGESSQSEASTTQAFQIAGWIVSKIGHFDGRMVIKIYQKPHFCNLAMNCTTYC